MAQVSLHSLNKIYGSGKHAVHAVRDLNLEIADGEFIALLGPSGCGKTSTLRMIVGLESITSGDIKFDGQLVSQLEPQQRNVAMAFETYALYPNFTVEQNLTFPLEARGIAAADRLAQAHKVAELLRITSILDQKPPQLSGGQQQRVSLGRALVREPAVFILDEVMSHLDAHLKFQMLFDLKKLHRELGRTMIYVTHDQVEALALADRVAVMSNSLLQQVGNRNALYNQPVNRFVADFIGEPPTNFFPAGISKNNDSIQLAVANSDLSFTVSDAVAGEIQRRGMQHCTVGIRPQNLRLSDNGAHNSAKVLINEYLGERSILTLTNGSIEFRALVPPDTLSDVGDLVSLQCDCKHVMVFDADTEELVTAT